MWTYYYYEVIVDFTRTNQLYALHEANVYVTQSYQKPYAKLMNNFDEATVDFTRNYCRPYTKLLYTSNEATVHL